MLIAAGADLELPASDGPTPLYIAAQNGQLACVRELLAAGAKPPPSEATPIAFAP